MVAEDEGGQQGGHLGRRGTTTVASSKATGSVDQIPGGLGCHGCPLMPGQAADALQTMRFCSTCAWTSPLFAMSSQQVSSQGHRRPGPRVLNGGPRAGDAGSGQ